MASVFLWAGEEQILTLFEFTVEEPDSHPSPKKDGTSVFEARQVKLISAISVRVVFELYWELVACAVLAVVQACVVRYLRCKCSGSSGRNRLRPVNNTSVGASSISDFDALNFSIDGCDDGLLSFAHSLVESLFNLFQFLFDSFLPVFVVGAGAARAALELDSVSECND